MDDPLIEYMVERALHTKMLHGLLAEGYIDNEVLSVFDRADDRFKPDMVVPFYPPGFGNDG